MPVLLVLGAVLWLVLLLLLLVLRIVAFVIECVFKLLAWPFRRAGRRRPAHVQVPAAGCYLADEVWMGWQPAEQVDYDRELAADHLRP